MLLVLRLLYKTVAAASWTRRRSEGASLCSRSSSAAGALSPVLTAPRSSPLEPGRFQGVGTGPGRVGSRGWGQGPRQTSRLTAPVLPPIPGAPGQGRPGPRGKIRGAGVGSRGEARGRFQGESPGRR